jgi:hypothetical protein
VPSPNNIIATARTVRGALDRPEAVDSLNKAAAEDPVKAAAISALFGRVRASIDQAQNEMGEGILAVPHSTDDKAREAAILLSMLAEGDKGTVTTEPLPQGMEAKFDTHDWLGWMTVAFEKMKHWKPHPMPRPPVRIDPFPRQGRAAVIGDWGTNLYGAPVCTTSIETDPDGFAMLLHLGDVYYSGTRKEVRSRFLDVWPKRQDPELVQRAINSNHEMYSGGDAYFDDSLPFFGQEASYFAFANDHWLLVGLDTAYVDHDVDESQVAWLQGILRHPDAARKKVVFFSHQQLFSRLESQGHKLAEEAKLGAILREGRVHAWYWGHEHRCVIYEQHRDYGWLLARCIGHGGMPETRKKVKDWTVERTVETQQDPVLWRRFDTLPSVGGRSLSPAGLVLDGRNRYVTGEEEEFAPHGYAVLSFNGPDLVEQVFTPDRALVHEQKVG